VERTTGIVLNLLEFTRPKDPAKVRTNLNSLLEESAALLENKLSTSRIDLRRKYGDLPPVAVDPSQMKNVFINLVVNAAEAMEEGGILTLSSRHDAAAGTVELEVADTGPGIPEHLRETVFDPFFTTKGKGTGLGLSVVAGIVQKHGGRIEVRSDAGAGTCMVVVLPAEA
jgi:two-component system NtrC family sensor kinase